MMLLTIFLVSFFVSNSYDIGVTVTQIDKTIWTIYQDKKSNYWFGSKENGVYYYLVAVNIPSVDGSPEISVSPLEIIVLKDFLEVNETWTQNLTQTTTITGVPPITTAVNITGKVLERDATLEVGSTTFENVIKVEVIQNTQGQVNTNYYWFAKDIGVIKYQNIIQGTNTTSELVSYTIN